MDATSDHESVIACQCGRIELRAGGPPIVRSACYCRSCQAAGRLIGALPAAPPVLGPDGGTDYLLFRKDRIRCTRGGEHLEELRLKPESPTRRMVAGCCNAAMFLDFTKGHWLTIYRDRIAGPVPPLQMRVMTADRPEGVVLPSDAPQYPARAGGLMGKLLAAWMAMGFRVPVVKGVPAKTLVLSISASDA